MISRCPVARAALLWLLACAFAVSASAKMFSGYDASFVLPQWLFVLSTCAEVCIAWMLSGRNRKWGLMLALGFCAAASALALVFPSGNCGCMGRLASLTSGRDRFLLASVLGALCAISYGAERATATAAA
jgi:hypothetical protein